MKPIPSLIILADRKRLVVYRATDSGSLLLIDSIEPMEGNDNISDLVTDQAEAFPTDDPGTSGYEGMPLTDEMEIRSQRQIAGKIEEILEREKPMAWGFGASPILSEAILDLLSAEHLENLSVDLRQELTQSDPVQVRARCEEALRHSLDQPHHASIGRKL